MASVAIKEDDIYLILKNFNPEKAGWDDISIRMIQICGKAIVETLQILFLSILKEGVYPDDWKKSNVVPTHKKESKNLIKNYRPISLFHVSSTVFERIIFKSLFNYFFENKLLSKCQAPFLPHNSTTPFLYT